jgi:hypothetical protein
MKVWSKVIHSLQIHNFSQIHNLQIHNVLGIHLHEYWVTKYGLLEKRTLCVLICSLFTDILTQDSKKAEEKKTQESS